MSPENQWLEDVFPIKIVPFSGEMLVFGGVMDISRFRSMSIFWLQQNSPSRG